MRKALLCMALVVIFATMLCGVSYSETETETKTETKAEAKAEAKAEGVKSGNIFQSVADNVRNMQAPSVLSVKPSAAPSVVENKFKRDVLGQKVPVETVMGGDAMTDTATKYESTLITGKE